MTTTYRKLTPIEIEQATARIRYQGDIDFNELREGILRVFGSTAHCVVAHFGAEYNDESYDIRCSDLTVTDAAGNEVEAATDSRDDVYDLRRDMRLGAASGEEDSFTVTYLLNTAAPALPDLYVREESE